MTDVNKDIQTFNHVNQCGYRFIESKGHGSYGLVSVVNDGTSAYAMKYEPFPKDYLKYGLENSIEINILSRVRHPNIINILKIFTPFHNPELNGTAIILPLADQTLIDISTSPFLRTEHKIPILFKIACSIHFLHQNNILHTDIKMGNIVIKNNGLNPYLIDFGLAMIVDDVEKGESSIYERTTLNYRAPELFAQSLYHYNNKCDVWSFGIVFLYLIHVNEIFGKDFYEETNPLKQKEILLSYLKSPNFIENRLSSVSDPKIKELMLDLLNGILNINSEKRFNMNQIVYHPLFNKYLNQIPSGYMIDPEINTEYADDHRSTLKIMLQVCVNSFEDADARLYFGAVDLYNRIASHYRNRTPYDRLILGISSIWITAKIIRKDENSYLENVILNTKKFIDRIDIEKVLQVENEIIELSNGILYSSTLYNRILHDQMLIFAFADIIMSKDPKMYGTVDIDQFIIQYQSVYPNSNDPKNIPLKSLTG